MSDGQVLGIIAALFITGLVIGFVLGWTTRDENDD